MDQQERIRTSFERNARALALRPALGRGTASTRVTVRDGLTCDVEDGPWRLTADMGEKSGGNNQGPNPGVLGRAALGTCLAVSYMLWASKLNVAIARLEVEVQTDYDSRGYHGVDDVPAGYEAIRYLVTVKSEASETEVLRALDMADRNSDFLALYRNPQEVTREVRVLAPRG
ncbi:MAG: OsmC family protein [Gemmatimonadaceae bacterium]